MNRVNQQAGFILKSQPFKETSLIHQVFTRDYGVISIISKGSRAKNSKHGSLLQPFRLLLFSWVGKSDLKTLTSVEEGSNTAQLKGRSLYCGFYVNELILNLLHKHDAHTALFEMFKKTFFQLSKDEHLEANLRQFEKVLFDQIGYGLMLEQEIETRVNIQPDKYYIYRVGYGAVVTNDIHHTDAILGSTLINLRRNQLHDKNELNQAKRLMRKLIDAQLDGKILKSRELFV
ncbi:MAG: DNA repair protein RecO [Cycloclasticus sp.]|nr:MAG: DNA repair protein RecO [Cycloclasticus sp.]